MKPFCASCSAGFSSSSKGMVPNCRAAFSHSAGVPGTPTDSPEVCTSANAKGFPAPSV